MKHKYRIKRVLVLNGLDEKVYERYYIQKKILWWWRDQKISTLYSSSSLTYNTCYLYRDNSKYVDNVFVANKILMILGSSFLKKYKGHKIEVGVKFCNEIVYFIEITKSSYESSRIAKVFNTIEELYKYVDENITTEIVEYQYPIY